MNKINEKKTQVDLVDEILDICNKVLKLEKATQKNGSIVFTPNKVLVKKSKKIIGSVIVINKIPTFQYTIDQAPK